MRSSKRYTTSRNFRAGDITIESCANDVDLHVFGQDRVHRGSVSLTHADIRWMMDVMPRAIGLRNEVPVGGSRGKFTVVGITPRFAWPRVQLSFITGDDRHPIVANVFIPLDQLEKLFRQMVKAMNYQLSECARLATLEARRNIIAASCPNA